MHKKTDKRYSLFILFFSLFFIFSLLVVQFYKIQILENEKWIREANKQHFFVLKEPFRRGTFFSNPLVGRAHPDVAQSLAFDIEKYHLHADPQMIGEKFCEPIMETLALKLHLSEKEKEKMSMQLRCKSRDRLLAMWLDEKKMEEIMTFWKQFSKENRLPRNALFFVRDWQRSYPFGKLLGQVLHTVRHRKEEETMQAIPTGGMELFFNEYLKGKQGRRLQMRSPRHFFDLGKVLEEPLDGADIYLTVNHCLQAIAEEEIAKGVKAANAKGGWAVMMNPRTGDIYALAQYPFFYPPLYGQYFQDADLIDYTKIKALTEAYEPASVMKPITLSCALLANEVLLRRGESALFDPEEKVYTAEGVFPGRKKRLQDLRVHKYLNMYMGLQKSSNVYMAKLVGRCIQRLGEGWYSNTLEKVFGFGLSTNLEVPSESCGFLPSLVKGERYRKGWSKATPYSLAIGHNIQVNTIQLLRAYATFLNGGYLVEPTLVKKIVIRDDEGKEKILLNHAFDEERKKKFVPVLDPKICQEVIKAMRYVTKRGGSGWRAEVPGYTVAGKTGTSEKVVDGKYSSTLHTANFIGFSPVEDPAFLLMVVIDEPECKYIPGVGKNHHGGTSAAPVFRNIAKKSLKYLGITPDDPFSDPLDSRYNVKEANWIKENQELQDKYSIWNS